MTTSLRTRLLVGLLGLLVATGALVGGLAMRSVHATAIEQTDRRLVAQADAVAAWLVTAGHPDRLAAKLAAVTASELTIVDAQDRVLGSSNPGLTIGSALPAAPELATARTKGVGRGIHPLVPGAPPAYVVARLDAIGRVVMLAVPMAEVEAGQGALRTRLLVVGALGLLAALVIGLLAIRQMTKPLAAITAGAMRLGAGQPLALPSSVARGPRELALLGATLADMSSEVTRRVAEVTAARDQAAAVVEALAEGVLATDAGGHVVLANAVIAELLGEVPTLGAPMPSALRGEAVELELGGRQLRVTRRPRPGGGDVMVLYDLTRLRALDRVRREFLANAAHQLRTPVTAIAGYAETLAAGDVAPADAAEFLAAIQRGAGRISRLVADLLTLEQLEAATRAPQAPTAIDLAALVHEVVATTRATAPDATIAVDVAPTLRVRGAREALQHVLQNLVDNAVRHGGGTVEIAATADATTLTLTVRDRGVGIAPPHRERVVERFYRVPGTPGEGSGLGLAIVAELVRGLGGTLRLDDNEPRGTVVTVTLPAFTEM